MKKTVEKDYNLTSKQKDVLKFIKQFSAKNKYPPSVRQICSAMDLKSPATVHVHINHLINKGILKRSNQGNHLLELLIPNEYDVKSDEVVNVALITKDSTVNSLEVPDKFFSLPSNLIEKKKEVFAIEVYDDSMVNAGINNNDVVIIEKCDDAENDDIIATTDEYEKIVIRTLYKENEYFRLQPENDLMTPIVSKEVKVLGKVIGLYRKF